VLSYQGLPFITKRRPLLSFFHIYCDESGKHKSDPVICFAGLCIRSEVLDEFDSQWKGLLRQYGLSELHMKKMSRLSQQIGTRFLPRQTGLQRVELLKPFADCINKFMEVGMLQVWDSKGFSFLPKKQREALGGVKDPYHLAFIRGLDEVAEYCPVNEQVLMICDDDTETAWECYRMYRALKNASPNVGKKVKSLAFADSETFPALQAADLAAYLGRKEGELRWRSKRYIFHDLLNHLTDDQTPGKMIWKAGFFDEGLMKGSNEWPTDE